MYEFQNTFVMLALYRFGFSDVWGFDEDAVHVLHNMRPHDESLILKYAVLLGEKELKVSEVSFKYSFLLYG